MIDYELDRLLDEAELIDSPHPPELAGGARHPLQDTVNYRMVPTFRGLALAMKDAADHGAPHLVYSSDRRDAVIAAFNRRYGTHLHGQQWLIDAHARDPTHYFPANPVDETSHCLFSDGNGVYRTPKGVQIPRRGRLPWYMVGIDAQDVGPHAQSNDCSHLVHVLNHLGYKCVQPYHAGSERHHFVFLEHPRENLKRRGIVK